MGPIILSETNGCEVNKRVNKQNTLLHLFKDIRKSRLDHVGR